jgi:hypothetical protein
MGRADKTQVSAEAVWVLTLAIDVLVPGCVELAQAARFVKTLSARRTVAVRMAWLLRSSGGRYLAAYMVQEGLHSARHGAP